MSLPDAVIVTGAGRGLGRAVAQSCAADGLPVLCIARTENATMTRDALLADGGRAESLVADLADLPATEEAVRCWIESRPYRRLAVVCAAGTVGEPGGIFDGDLTDWAQT